MPDQEPLPDAPEFIFAGPLDAQAYFDRIGMSWLAAWAGNIAPRLVTVSELCALPQPASQPFTMTDVISMQMGDAGAEAARQKLANWVDADLWQSNCRYTNADPADVAAPQAPPTGLPDLNPPSTGDKLLRELWTWLEWMRRMMVPREYLPIGVFSCTGQGTVDIPGSDEGDWFVYAAGVQVFIEEYPEWIGQQHSGPPQMFFNAGYFSIGDANIAQAPIRIQRLNQMTYGSLAQVTRFSYNLLPGVSITMIPLYPVTTKANE